MIVSNDELLVALLKTTTISAAHQAVLTLIHTMVEDSIKRTLMYDPTYNTHVEYYPVQSKRRPSRLLQVRHVPIRRVTEIVTDTEGYGGQASGAFTTANGAEVLVSGTNYFMHGSVSGIGGTNGLAATDGFCRSGLIENILETWPVCPGSIRVTYVAGYTEQEFRGQGTYHNAGQIKKATLDALVASFKELLVQATAIANNTSGPKVSENFGDYSYSIDAMSAATTNFEAVIPGSSNALLALHRNYGQLGM